MSHLGFFVNRAPWLCRTRVNHEKTQKWPTVRTDSDRDPSGRKWRQHATVSTVQCHEHWR